MLSRRCHLEGDRVMPYPYRVTGRVIGGPFLASSCNLHWVDESTMFLMDDPMHKTYTMQRAWTKCSLFPSTYSWQSVSNMDIISRLSTKISHNPNKCPAYSLSLVLASASEILHSHYSILFSTTISKPLVVHMLSFTIAALRSVYHVYKRTKNY
jgi:hypothetical protein